jgi:hypothetical protein
MSHFEFNFFVYFTLLASNIIGIDEPLGSSTLSRISSTHFLTFSSVEGLDMSKQTIAAIAC